MLLCSHPTGNANVRQAVLAFAEAGLLGEFWTSVSWHGESFVNRILPDSLRITALRRCVPALVRPKSHHRLLRESARLILGTLGSSRVLAHGKKHCDINSVYRALDRKTAQRTTGGNFSGVYCYEDGANETFKRAAEKSVKRFYDLPIGYWREWQGIREEETRREPEWASTLQGISDSDEKLARKDEELRLAQTVFVASTFTRSTLQKAPKCEAEVHVIPYGSPPLGPARKKRSCSEPLRVLFVGALSQRKGLSYLFKAVSELRSHVLLTLIGARPNIKSKVLDAVLHQHRWIASLPYLAVLHEMRRNDLLVFPSLFEGFGLVILEAMSQGLPVITTAQTAGPDLITDGREGFIIPIRSHESIVERVSLLATDPGLLFDMQNAARDKAGTLSWRAYRNTVSSILRESMEPND